MTGYNSNQYFSENSITNSSIEGVYEDIKPVSRPGDMNDMNEPLYRQPSGKFFAKIYDKDTEKPIKDVKISIYEMTEEGRILTSRQSNVITVHTNEFGETDTVALPAPPKENALEPLGAKPYFEYAVSIEAAGYAPVILRGTQIFADVTAKQMMELIPVSGTEGRQSVEVIDISEHTLIGQYPQQEQQPQQPQQPQPQSTRRNGDYDVLIPEFVIVHDGHPNTPAPRYKVKFKDYIKNVLASEVFPSWRKDALLANALCVMSYTLNRIYTGYYEGKGFTITGITQFDHKYTHGRNTFEETDNVVEEVFKQYIAKPGKIEPLFAQYRAGKKVPCPYASRPGMLYQWGTACLAEQGMNYIEILKYYYKEVEIRLAEFIQVIKPFPGFNLKEGDQKEAVHTVQKYLYHIRKKYKDIPEINVNGIFDPNTTNAVKSFQKHFKLPENGVVDELTWNKITDIYVYVTNLPGIFPILQMGSHGESVKILQILLKKFGFYVGEVDGVFGMGTDQSVKEFQKIKGFTITGVVRKELWKVLEEMQFSVIGSRTSLPNVTNNSMFHGTHTSINENKHNPSSNTNVSSTYSPPTSSIPNTSAYQQSTYPYYGNGYSPFY